MAKTKRKFEGRQAHTVIIGGGFAGLYAARQLGKHGAPVTLIDKRNFHLFQPLLYQVATGGLSPGDIASPLRAILKKHRNTRVIQAEAGQIDAERKLVIAGDEQISYDYLIIATGMQNHHFGNEGWSRIAPGLKTVEDALEMRRRIFSAYEEAEKEKDPRIQAALLTFTIVGGGPTGVELAGAIGELSRYTLENDFRNIDPQKTRILLIEGGSRILPTFRPKLAAQAAKKLQRLGVQIITETMVTAMEEGQVTIKSAESIQQIATRTILWGAGVKPSPMAGIIAAAAGAALDRSGRVRVEPELHLAAYPEIYVIGDLAHVEDRQGKPLPGVAPVAMQQGRYVADTIIRRMDNKSIKPFHYFNKGNLAVIGRNAAIAERGKIAFSGWFAWLTWVFVHIAYLIEFDSRVLVLFQWASNYFTRKRGARLITEEAEHDPDEPASQFRAKDVFSAN